MKIRDIAVFLKKYRHYDKNNAILGISMSKLENKHIKLKINRHMLYIGSGYGYRLLIEHLAYIMLHLNRNSSICVNGCNVVWMAVHNTT